MKYTIVLSAVSLILAGLSFYFFLEEGHIARSPIRLTCVASLIVTITSYNILLRERSNKKQNSLVILVTPLLLMALSGTSFVFEVPLSLKTSLPKEEHIFPFYASSNAVALLGSIFCLVVELQKPKKLSK